MKNIFTILFLATLIFQVKAQTANAVVYSEMGEKFTLYINSESQNDKPMSNVKVNGLTAEYYQARIDFEDPTLADFANSNFAVQKGLEVTYVVKKNKKGEYVLRYQGEAAINGALATETPKVVQKEYNIAVVDEIPVEETEMNMDVEMVVDAPIDVAQEEIVEIKTTTTTTGGAAKPETKTNTTKTTENVSMGINVGGVNMGVNFKVDESNIDMNMDVEESSTTTTTTTKTTTTVPAPATSPKPATAPKPAVKPATKPAVKPDVVIVEGVAGCSKAMSSSDFTGAKTNISGKAFEDQKLSTAKTIAKANCLTTAQIKETCALFAFEDSKLTFAKYAYDYCTDKGNYYLVSDVFSFSSSSEELEQFISSK